LFKLEKKSKGKNKTVFHAFAKEGAGSDDGAPAAAGVAKPMLPPASSTSPFASPSSACSGRFPRPEQALKALMGVVFFCEMEEDQGQKRSALEFSGRKENEKEDKKGGGKDLAQSIVNLEFKRG